MAHAAGDSHEYPIYGAHFRVVFPIFDADGDLVTGATGLDSERSIDMGAFADCTNEATEIATSSGMYYLDLTGAEMTGNAITVIVKTTTVGAKTTPITLYPRHTFAVETGTAAAGAASTITLPAPSSTVNDAYNGLYILITNNTPAGAQYQARRIIDYVGSTKVATVESAWGTNPSSSSTYEILVPDVMGVSAWMGTKIPAPTNPGFPLVDLAIWNSAAVPNNLISGRVDASVGAMAASVITAAATAADFLAEVNAEVDTALTDYDAPTFAELDARTDAIEADTQDIQARLPAALVSGRIDASVGAVAANAITDDAIAADMDSYNAKCWVIRQSTTADQYGVTFYKNGQPIAAGITSPLIDYVKKLSDATILINDATLTDQSDGDYYYGEATNKLVAGNAYMMRVTATIDGSTWVFKQQIGRDAA
jgi:hypothetical protein